MTYNIAILPKRESKDVSNKKHKLKIFTNIYTANPVYSENMINGSIEFSKSVLLMAQQFSEFVPIYNW